MSDAPRQPPPKKEVALALLEGPSLFVHLDPRRPGVAVPKWFTGQPQLVLQVGLNMAIPIPDLKVEEVGITCTLSFNRTPFWCRLPWSAIYALVGEDGRGMVWPDDVPNEVAAQMAKQQAAAPKQGQPKKPRAKLAAVESGGEEEAPRRRKEDKAPPSKEPRRGLAAVPPARPSATRSPMESEESEAEADAPNEPEAAGAETSPVQPARPRAGNGKKPKRELPPYLRVIK